MTRISLIYVTALIKEGHRIAADLGFAYSVVLGSENYYPKFGKQWVVSIDAMKREYGEEVN